MTITDYILLAILIIFYPVWFSYEYYQLKTGVAVFPTMGPMRRKIIENINQIHATSNVRPFRILDLGSGSGQLTWHIARAMPGVEVLGVEFAPIPYLRSVLRQKLWGPKNLYYRRGDFMQEDISNIDIIVTYLVGGLMNKVSEKLRRELKPGAVIMAATFPLRGDWVPYETIEVRVPLKVKLSLYRQ
jgi:SAM-dependent methyltransferase